MTLNPVCESVETAQGVPLTVTGVAQVKIMKNADLLQTASDQFPSLVREVASPDVGRMGIEILSFTIKDVYDN